MKKKLSVSLDESTFQKVEELLINGVFRNKSHVVEFALRKLSSEKRNLKNGLNHLTLDEFEES